MTELHLTIYGHAEPAGSKTMGVTKDGRRFFRDANPRAMKWKEHIRREAARAMLDRDAGLDRGHSNSAAALLAGPLRLSAVFYRVRPKSHYGTGKNANKLKISAPRWPTTKPDLDKLIRALKDGLTGAVYRDDSQVVEHGYMAKTYGEPARVEVTIETVSDDDESVRRPERRDQPKLELV